MAVLSDYTSGTITLANGSTAVTGTGTLFQSAQLKEGDTLQIQNLTAVIASVNSNTSLTLTAPWTGTSLTDAPYRARFLPDGSRQTSRSTTLIELLSNGVLSNLAELGVEDGKVPVGNAAGEYELKDQSALGIQDPTGSLGKFAALTLAAGKILNTDASGELTQSDITAAALVLLKLAGTVSPNKLAFFDTADSAALADFTAPARALLNLSGTAAADRLPYLTGNSGADLTTLTSFARTVLDDTNGTQMWSSMGGSLGSSAIKFPNGTLIQGTRQNVMTDSGGYASITWPTAFGNSSYFVFALSADNQNYVGIPSGTIWNASQGLTAVNVYCVNRTSGATYANSFITLQVFGWGVAP